jgi:uncharacterized repeat protein (TIGR01451 family)
MGRFANLSSVLRRAGSSAWARTALLLALLATAPIRAQTPPGTDIVNVAHGSYVSLAGSHPTSRQSASNQVVTRVRGIDCVPVATLRVAPEGTVAPGDALTYTVELRNDGASPLVSVEVRLPLDPGLDAPVSVTGPSSAVGSYDPTARVVVWTLAGLDPHGVVQLVAVVPVRADAAADSAIVAGVEVRAASCTSPVPSNEVTTGVVPPVLTLTKRADRSTLMPGDAVTFVLELTHAGAVPDFPQAVLVDQLPQAMRYARGTARLDGSPVADPQIAPNGTLTFDLGPVLPGTTHTLAFAAIVVPTAHEGLVTNAAHIEAETPGNLLVRSNTATASVEVVPGIFRDEAYLIGRVFIDDDADGLPGHDEPGVPGVLVRLENGWGAVTDLTGRWHIEGVRPGLHVARIDPATLPETLRPLAGGADWVGDRGTRFVEARSAELVVADFPVGPGGSARCSVRVGESVVHVPWASLFDVRGTLTGPGARAVDAARAWREDMGGPAAPVDITCEGAPTVERTEAEAALRHRLAPDARQNEAPAEAHAPPATPSFESLLRSAPPNAAIVAPQDGSRARRDHIDVDVIHPLGTVPALRINGTLVPAERIGVTAELESRAIAATRFVGLALAAGANDIELRTGEGDGAQVARIMVTLPGDPVELRLSEADVWIADRVTPAILVIEAVDVAGVRSHHALTASLLIEGAEPVAPDPDPNEDGYQVRLNDGLAEVALAPLTVPGRIHVLAASGNLEAEEFLPVRPSRGAWQATGLVEGHLAGDAGVEGDGGRPPSLEDEITDDGGRVAVFARGPVGSASTVTLSIDTDRDPDRTRHENYFAPDLFYPVSGDASARTNESPTQGPVFVRYDTPSGFAQWGDFSTGFDRAELSRYDRRLTGATGRFGDERITVEGFGASTDQQVVRDVYESDGTSGPYLLSRSPVVAGSEAVFLEVHDRFRTEEVISRRAMRRDADYSLDPYSGTILFRSPIAAFESGLDPVRVVVLYEAAGGGDDQLAIGGRVALQATKTFDVGASAIVEERIGEDLALYGTELRWRPRPGTTVEFEAAGSDVETSETALRFEVASRTGNALDWGVTYLDLPAEFDNPTYLGSPELGSERVAGKLEWRPSDAWRVRGEAFALDDEARDLQQRVAALDVRRAIGRMTGLLGAKFAASENPTTGEATSPLVTVGIGGPIAGRWSADVLHEHALSDESVAGYPTRTAAGVAYQIDDGTKAFLKQEWQSSDAGPDRDRTLAGIESRVGRYGRALAQYSLEDAVDGYVVRSLTGVETAMPAGERGSIAASASTVRTSLGDSSADYTSLTAGYEHRAGHHVIGTRYEIRLGEADDRHLFTAAGTFHPQDALTFFVRERLFLTDPDAGDRAWRGEGLVGVAFRPRGHGFRFLARLDHTGTDGTPTGSGAIAPGGVYTTPSSSFFATPQQTGTTGIGTGYDRAFGDRGWIAFSVAAGARLARDHRIGWTVTARRVDGDEVTGAGSTSTSLLALHYTGVIHPRLTIGLSARRFAERTTDVASYGYGAETGYLAARNIWLVTGYNFAGIDDDSLPGLDRAEEGPFLGLRFKFDESSLKSLSDLRLDRP